MDVVNSVCLKRMAGRAFVDVGGTWMNNFPEV